MQNRPKISEAEWEVMKVLWGKSPAPANEVVNTLAQKTQWKPKTIKTLINRLVRKKAIGYQKDGRQYLYYPLVSQEECVRAETRSFIERVKSGAVTPMLAAFLEEEKLTLKEIEQLKEILDRKGANDANHPS